MPITRALSQAMSGSSVVSMEKTHGERHEIAAGPEDSGKRLDVVLAARVPGLSRTRARDLIRDGTIDGLVYGAADSALFKTADYFAGTAFKLKALAGGRSGKMIGYGALHPLIVPAITPTTIVSTVGQDRGRARSGRRRRAGVPAPFRRLIGRSGCLP